MSQVENICLCVQFSTSAMGLFLSVYANDVIDWRFMEMSYNQTVNVE